MPKKSDKLMVEPIFTYDELSDTLYISFAPGEKATGIELNENLLLRINKAERRAIGLTVFNYSILAQKTATGIRSLPLSGLTELSQNLHQLTLEILLRPPVKEFLTISTYTPSHRENIPIATLHIDLLALA
jgi:uncharacterized protein YuzE